MLKDIAVLLHCTWLSMPSTYSFPAAPVPTVFKGVMILLKAIISALASLWFHLLETKFQLFPITA